MAFVHGKSTFVSLNAVDLSTFCTNSQITRESDSHDTTTYGAEHHNFQGGLKNGTASIEGIYDNTAGTGPRAVIRPLIGSKVELIRRPEGTGAGKPQEAVDVLVQNYVETNPVADMISWSANLQLTELVTDTTQA